MARPRKPTKVLEASGAFRKDPQRKRGPEPESRGALGNAPDWFTELQTAHWKLIAEKAPEGVLREADHPAVVAAACLGAMMEESRGLLPAAYFAQHRAAFNALGMSPTGRAQLGVQGQDGPKQNPFANLDK